MDVTITIEKVEDRTIWYYSTDKSHWALYTYEDEPKGIYLANVYVNEEFRKQNEGNKILEEVTKNAIEMGGENLFLMCDKSSWVESWYKRHGFSDFCDENEYSTWLVKKL